MRKGLKEAPVNSIKMRAGQSKGQVHLAVAVVKIKTNETMSDH